MPVRSSPGRSSWMATTRLSGLEQFSVGESQAQRTASNAARHEGPWFRSYRQRLGFTCLGTISGLADVAANDVVALDDGCYSQV
jgi:hypothetical protein